MPLKLNVGLSQKIGQPDYGSLGASCHVEMELDSHMLEQAPDQFRAHVNTAYYACRRAVEEELARGHEQPTAEVRSTSANALNGSRSRPANGSQPITTKQLDYVRQLCQQIVGFGAQDLAKLVQRRHQQTLEELTSFQASALIDTLRQIKAGRLDPSALLGKEAA